MDKHILFVGMGDWDVPMLEIARDAGYKTIATNRDEKALCLQEADVPIFADGRDVYAILSYLYCHHLQDSIASVYTGTELFTTVALIAQSLNIPWHSPLSAYISENKALMREKFEEYGISHPSAVDIQSGGVIGYDKCVIKPADSLSSQGVTIVDNAKDVERAVERALEHSASKRVVCEEFIEGTLHDLNGILTSDGLLRMGVNDKTAGPPPYTIITEVSCPTKLSKDKQIEMYTLFEEACRAMGLGNGPVKGDMIMDGQGNFYVLEVASRFHGPLGTLHIVPLALNISPFAELLNWLDGKNVKEHDVAGEYPRVFSVVKLDKKENLVEKGRIIQILEKQGINDSRLWKSNYDVPIYVVREDTAA